MPPTRTTPPYGVAEAEDEDGQRPTVVPTFDPEAFARDSETRQRAASAVDRGEPTVEEARRLHERGDHADALFMLAEILQLTPRDREASDLSSRCRVALERECLAALGSETAVLVLAVTEIELKTFAIDHTCGFLLSFMDGTTTVEDILDVSGMPRLLALRHLRTLHERGIVKRLADFRQASTLPPPGPGQDFEEGPEVAPDSGVVPLRLAIPSRDAVPVLLVLREDLESIGLEQGDRLLVSLVDDKATVGDILDRAKIDLDDGMAMFERLAEDGVVAFL